MPATPANIAILLIQAALLVGGIVLLYRHVLSPAARAASRQAGPLKAWNISIADFLSFLFLMVGGGLVSSFIGGLVIARLEASEDTKVMLGSAVFQLGLLIGPAVLPLNLGHHPLRPTLNRSTLRSGLATFFIAIPIVTLVNILWIQFLTFAELPTKQQDLVRLFTDAKSPGLIALFIVFATIIAPITEELLFRATMFRYLRTRVPRWIALLVPGTIFAALHVNWITFDGLPSLAPLVTLAVIFSLAYERTGQIATAIVAHSLFNLLTILMVLLGVTE
jgi:membrane protease YdiL (CAAX protease family)